LTGIENFGENYGLENCLETMHVKSLPTELAKQVETLVECSNKCINMRAE